MFLRFEKRVVQINHFYGEYGLIGKRGSRETAPFIFAYNISIIYIYINMLLLYNSLIIK